MTPTEIATIQAIQTIASTLSVIGCVTVLSRFFRSGSVWNITNKQVIVLCSIDLITAIFWGIGHAGHGNKGFCEFQAFMIQWGGLSNICWNSAIALHLYHWIAKKKNESKLNKKLRKTAIVSIGLPFLLSIILLASGVYGPADMWCWITDDYTWIRFVFFYLILVAAWVFNVYILRKVSDAVSSRVASKDGAGGGKQSKKGLFSAEAGIQQKLRQYIAVFVLAWFFGLLNRFAEACAGEPVFTTTLLHAFFVPLQGFMNACCYGDAIKELSAAVKSLKTTMKVVEDAARKRNNSSEGKPALSARVSYTPKQVSIFVSSFNQGEATLEEMSGDIAGWMLEGHDMYVIGLQECMCLEEFRAAMHAHLGGEEAFQMYVCEIGSNNTRLGFHGFIALTVFVRTEDIRNGFIKKTEASASDHANGTDLIVTTAANKGAVGLPFQIHDTSIGFVTAHLPSDSKGKSKLGKRNGAARSMLQEVVLASEDVGGDMHFLHDHLVVLGDLNYRMNPPAAGTPGAEQSSLSSIASASLAEMRAMHYDPDWFKKKYELFYGPKASRCLSVEDRALIIAAAEASAAEWDVVLACDEMSEMMRIGEVFFGFNEVPPRFPPTYKRKKGAAGDCGDYSSVADLIQGYSHTGEEAADLDDSRHSTTSSVSERDSDMDSSAGGSLAFKMFAPATDVEQGPSDSSEEPPTPPPSPAVTDRSKAPDAPKEDSTEVDTVAELPPSSLTSASLQKTSGASADSPAKKKAPNRRQSMFSMRRGSILALSPEKEEEKKKSKLRPPSYTDRVIVHSLVEDHKLMPTAYGFCDSVRGSDHRPVCMSMVLEVNSNILPARSSHSESAASSDGGEDKSNPYIALMALSVNNLDAVLSEKNAVMNPMLGEAASSLSTAQKSLIMNSINESEDGDEESQGPTRDLEETHSSAASTSRQSLSTALSRPSSKNLGSSPVPNIAEVIITFPLPGKDPLLEYRKMYDFAQAFNVSNESSGFFKISQVRGHRNKQKLKEELLKPKRAYPWATARSGVEIDSCVDVSLGVEALVKLVDADGEDLGQACVSLTHLLQQDRLGEPYSVEIPLSAGGKYKGMLTADFVLAQIPGEITMS